MVLSQARRTQLQSSAHGVTGLPAPVNVEKLSMLLPRQATVTPMTQEMVLD